MQSLSHTFIEKLDFILSGVKNIELQRFFLLTAVGKYGPYSVTWIDSFKSLGVLHLLVLSGSQVNYFYKAQNNALNILIKNQNIYADFFKKVILAIALFVFGEAAEWPPPLTRALMMAFVFLCLPRLLWYWAFAITLALQLLFFGREHLTSLSFYLSWFCFLCVQATNLLGLGRLAKCLTVSILAELLLFYILKKPISATQSLLFLLSNVVLGYIFDVLIMPLVGFVLLCAFFLSILVPMSLDVPVLAHTCREFWDPFLNSAAHLVLVVTKTLRYIGVHES